MSQTIHSKERDCYHFFFIILAIFKLLTVIRKKIYPERNLLTFICSTILVKDI